MKRLINEIIIHCSANQPSEALDVEYLRRLHKAKGWRDVGYHFVIKTDGTIEKGRPVNEAGAHCRGHNDHSIGICLIGGIDKNLKPTPNYSDAQMQSLRHLVNQLSRDYDVDKITGHRDHKGVKKACPCFDVQHWLIHNELRNRGHIIRVLAKSKRTAGAAVGTIAAFTSQLNEISELKQAGESLTSGTSLFNWVPFVCVLLAFVWVIYTKVLDSD